MTKVRNRGKEGRDDLLFGSEKQQQKIKEAIIDMSYLLSRGYAEKSSLSIIGNRYRLNVRQQKAVRGMSASEGQILKRKSTRINLNQLKNKEVIIDGFNLLIIIESALSGGYVFKGLDGCYRDLSSVHGTYKKVQKTEKALILIGGFLKRIKIKNALWIFDRPISNSGRLKTYLMELAKSNNYKWEVQLEYSPDKLLAQSDSVVISSDAWILDRVSQWFNSAEYLIENFIPESNIIYCD